MDTKIERVIKCLKRYHPQRIIIFGSGARGDLDEYSDLDFVVIKRTDKRFMDRLLEIAKLIDNDLGKVDVFVYTPEEFEKMERAGNPFIERVCLEGKVVYEAQ
jgi:predicted nucleotidyltransferase